MFTFRLILLCVIICNGMWCVKLVFRNFVRKGQVIQTPGAHMVSKLTSVSKFPGTQLNTITKTSPDYASKLLSQEICWCIYGSKYWMTSSSSNLTIRQMRCYTIQLSTYLQRFKFELKWAIYLISSPSLSFLFFHDLYYISWYPNEKGWPDLRWLYIHNSRGVKPITRAFNTVCFTVENVSNRLVISKTLTFSAMPLELLNIPNSKYARKI
jgi:hypothetical protein